MEPRKQPATTNDTGMLTVIQAIRFIAAMLVLLFHLGICPSGYKGVDLFFVISGFTLTYSLFFCTGNPALIKRHFIINRFTKIFVLYWLVLMAVFVINPFQLNSRAIGAILLIPGHHSVLGVSWSLSYELYFYFLFYILFLVIGKGKAGFFFTVLLVLSSIITCLSLSAYSLRGSWINFFAGQNLWQFLAGVMAARLFLKNSESKGHYSLMVFTIAIIFFVGVSIHYKERISGIVYGLLSFVIVYSAAFSERRFGHLIKGRKIINSLGNASYAVYLLSYPIILITGKHLHADMIICLVIVVSVAVNIFFEGPLLNCIRRKLRHRFAITAAS